MTVAEFFLFLQLIQWEAGVIVVLQCLWLLAFLNCAGTKRESYSDSNLFSKTPTSSEAEERTDAVFRLYVAISRKYPPT